jgi:hypothetical protein
MLIYKHGKQKESPADGKKIDLHIRKYQED